MRPLDVVSACCFARAHFIRKFLDTRVKEINKKRNLRNEMVLQRIVCVFKQFVYQHKYAYLHKLLRFRQLLSVNKAHSSPMLLFRSRNHHIIAQIQDFKTTFY